MRATLELSMALEAMALIDVGILAVDRSCQVLHANAFAEELLHLHPALRIERKRLIFSTPALQGRFAAMLRDSLLATDDGPSPMTAALSIASMDRLPMTLSIMPLRSVPGDTTPALAVVLVRDPEWPLTDIRCLRELFGFTQAEALVAADLVRGCLPDQIARQRGIGLSTARSHIKSIVSKTGTRRMAQAIAAISRSVATLSYRADLN